MRNTSPKWSGSGTTDFRVCADLRLLPQGRGQMSTRSVQRQAAFMVRAHHPRRPVPGGHVGRQAIERRLARVGGPCSPMRVFRGRDRHQGLTIKSTDRRSCASDEIAGSPPKGCSNTVARREPSGCSWRALCSPKPKYDVSLLFAEGRRNSGGKTGLPFHLAHFLEIVSLMRDFTQDSLKSLKIRLIFQTFQHGYAP